MLTMTVWFALLFILLTASVFFSATETAYTMSNKIRLKALAENGNASAKRVLKITGNYDRFISSVLTGNNIVNIGASSIATILFVHLFPEEIAVAISTVVVTIVVLVFCETLPKSFGKAYADEYALATSRLVGLMMIVFSPVVFILVKLINLIGWKKSVEAPPVTENELKYLIGTIEEEGVLEEEESDLVQSALDFDDTTAQEIMTPRSDITAVSIDEPLDAVLQKIIREGYTRMPVYKEDLDHVLGFVNAKDVLIRAATNRRYNLNHLIKPVTFVYVTKSISSLLTEMRQTKSQMAIVVDDYGSTNGIVTLEDILEELVGEIWDEHDEIISEIIEVEKDVFEVSSNMNLEDLFEYLNADDSTFECDYNTAGGWPLAVFERVPKIGDVFIYKNLRVTILDADEQRVIKLKIEKADEPITNEETKCGIEEKAVDAQADTKV